MEVLPLSTSYLNIKNTTSLVKDQANTYILYSILIVFLFSTMSSCVSIDNKFEGLPPGKWRAVLKLYDSEIDASTIASDKSEITYEELPFNFELFNDGDINNMRIEIINGEERIPINDITIGLDRATAKDTVIINFPLYNSYIKAIHEEGILEGNWFVNYKENYSIPFIAVFGIENRFRLDKKPPAVDLSGKWKTTFDFDKEDPYEAIGEFKQVGDKLTGTFLTETGDFRYLEGVVNGNKFGMSVFDGSHAFLFKGLAENENELVGIFKSGKHYNSNWKAVRDDNFTLKDPYNLSQIVNPEKAIDFEFENLDGKLVSINDDPFKDKLKLINIVGTWCPNCRDESKYIKSYLDQFGSDEIETISICFERFKNKEQSIGAIKKYKDLLKLDWTFLYGGIADKKENSKVLPFIDKLISYPTLLIVDKENKIRYVHTGFSGPATSKFDSFQKEFKNIMDELKKESI